MRRFNGAGKAARARALHGSSKQLNHGPSKRLNRVARADRVRLRQLGLPSVRGLRHAQRPLRAGAGRRLPNADPRGPDHDPSVTRWALPLALSAKNPRWVLPLALSARSLAARRDPSAKIHGRRSAPWLMNRALRLVLARNARTSILSWAPARPALGSS
jgi:hypothetical protein